MIASGAPPVCSPTVRRATAGVLVLTCLVATGTAGTSADERVRRGVTPLDTLRLEGSVMHASFDDAGRRLIVATVRYPEVGQRRDELHRYTIPSPGPVVHLGTTRISDSAAIGLSPDGEQIAVACGDRVCLHDWDMASVRTQLAARARPMEIGALALRPDVSLLVGAQRTRMEILAWDLDRGHHRSWTAAGVGERMREAVTPRLHGRPLWTPRWVGISPDASRVAAIRDDGTILLWTRGGESIKSLTLSRYDSVDPAFAPDGTLIALRETDGRLAAVDVERERVVLSVEAGASRSPNRAALLLGARASYLAVSRPTGVSLHELPSGDVRAVIPAPDAVWRIAMSGQGRVVAVATQHQVTLWHLTDTVR